MSRENKRIVAQNKKAWHDYFVEEALESGIELCGTEVKSVRMGRLNLKDAWCSVESGQIYLLGMHISPYEKGNIFNRDPVRKRRILLHKSEIMRLAAEVKQQGLTLIPLSVYFKGPFVKVEIGICKGKKLYDKRDDMAKRDASREIDRAIKERNR